MSHIQIDGLTKTYGGVTAVDGVSLDIPDGAFVTLLGPSGCGKTTTLGCVAGLEEATSGRIHFDGQDVTRWSPRDRNIGMVFQDYALYPHMDVFDNLAFGLRRRRLAKPEIQARVSESAEALGLTPLLHRRPSELSGGQRQRVALGRAIVRDATAFLMDEPLSNLDAALRVQTRSEIKRLQRDLGVTTLYVTHDQEEAMVLSDLVAVMKDGDVLQCADPATAYARPATVFVATFIGSPPINLIQGEVQRDGDAWRFRSPGLVLHLPPEVARGLPNAQVTLGARPETIKLVPPGQGSLNAEVVLVEPIGPFTHVTLRYDDRTVRASIPAPATVQATDKVGLTFEIARSLLFDSTDQTLVSPSPSTTQRA